MAKKKTEAKDTVAACFDAERRRYAAGLKKKLLPRWLQKIIVTYNGRISRSAALFGLAGLIGASGMLSILLFLHTSPGGMFLACIITYICFGAICAKLTYDDFADDGSLLAGFLFPLLFWMLYHP